MELLVTDLQQRVRVAGGRDNVFTISFKDRNREKASDVVTALLNTFVESSLGAQGDDADMTERAIRAEIDDHENRLLSAETALAEFKKRNIGYMPGDGSDYYTQLQAALDLRPTGGALDASDYTGVRLCARGNGEAYALHLRTPDNVRPWQSYRAQFKADAVWQHINIPFSAFTPHRVQTPLDISRLRRLGLVAIGRAFHADLAVCELALYRNPA